MAERNRIAHYPNMFQFTRIPVKLINRPVVYICQLFYLFLNRYSGLSNYSGLCFNFRAVSDFKVSRTKEVLIFWIPGIPESLSFTNSV